MFTPLLLAHWLPAGADLPDEGEAAVVVDPELPANRSLSLLHLDGGGTVLSVTPARAEELAVSDGERIAIAELTARIARAGIALNDPDCVFHLPRQEQAVLAGEERVPGTRALSADDAASFAAFAEAAPPADLDEAFIELDHWLVHGTFVGERLASAASMYPWSGTRLADLGVITLPEHRGQGLGRATVRAISAEALARGYEPQYRCQLENTASAALARAAGFVLLGTWEVVDSAD
ncbi:GNAT family N-acetyltransferase [Brachybacterium sp. DNPG3]